MMIKILAKSIREYKREALFASGFMVLEVIMEVLIPFFTASLIDFGIDDGNMECIARMGVMLIVFALMSLLFGAGSGFFSASAAAGFSANLRRDVFTAIQGFSFSNIDHFSSASLVTRLTTDVTNVLLAFQAIIRQAVRAVFMVAFALVMAYTTNAQVTLVLLAVTTVLGAGLILIAAKAHPFFTRALKTYDKLNNIVQENLQGIRVVKTFVSEESEKRKFKGISAEIYDAFLGGQQRVAFNMPIQLYTYISMILVSWIGTRQIVSDATGGSLFAVSFCNSPTLRLFFSQSLPQILSSVFTVLAVLVSMLILSPTLTVIVLVFACLTLFVSQKTSINAAKLYMLQQRSIGDLNGYIKEMINGQKVIKMFCHEDATLRDFDEKNTTVQRYGRKSDLHRAKGGCSVL